jgi:SP family sugar:H+ symporter-like MFS transporter
MTTASNWLLNWAIAYSTPYMVDAKYANLQSKVFFVWGSFCFVCIAFVYFFIYETKGLTLEEVDELYGMVGKAWQSQKFIPAVKFTDVEKEDARGRGESLADFARRRSVTEQGAANGANGTTPATTADAKVLDHEEPGAMHHNEKSGVTHHNGGLDGAQKV